ncbi:type IV secretion system protein [Acinetobacter oleivorans]|uniref:type IV secretion system protein n=1 Tax=Acinetobacter oleivorans TaxID=1148157 RepID=UPI001D17E53D|nr:type IV secretion system protein [Acinetobacter oleivorans]
MAISTHTNATGIPVFDSGNFANMIINATNQATQISQQVNQINQAIRGNGLSEQMLKQLGVSNYSSIIFQMSQQASDLNKVIQASNSLKHSVGQVQAEFKALYPNANSYKNKTPDQMLQDFSKWSNQLQNANATAMQAQASVGAIVDRNMKIGNILSESAGSAGASTVSQIQGTNQLLGILGQQMNDLHSVLATSQRATMEAQAQAQAVKDSQRQAWRDSTTFKNDYSYKGKNW